MPPVPASLVAALAVHPRLADAAFFWDSDRKNALASREEVLRDVVYQRGLGSLFDKSQRIGRLAGWLAKELDSDKDTVERAAQLAKCDLVTGMVGEFPDLQGIMGRYYAISGGEPDAVADAIEISTATVRNIWQNLFGAFIYNSLGIPVAAGILYPLDRLATDLSRELDRVRVVGHDGGQHVLDVVCLAFGVDVVCGALHGEQLCQATQDVRRELAGYPIV